MTSKRDKKGRVLRQGERQRKDGRYEYRYKDARGEVRSVYSWRLVESDSTPKGKKNDKPLREMEKDIIRDIEDGIDDHTARKMTLDSLFDIYIETKYELRPATQGQYKYMYRKYISDNIGAKSIAEIKYSDIKRFYIYLIKDVKLGPNSIMMVHSVLNPTLNTAVRDGLIRSNPANGVITELKRSYSWEIPKRHALTVSQQERFVEFMSKSPICRSWKSLFTVLLGTGMRIGEALGLTWEDCDFKQNIIHVNRTLKYYRQDGGKMTFHISPPKTRASVRIIPMATDVRAALLQIRREQMSRRLSKYEVDGYSNFVFLNRDGKLITKSSVNNAIERIIKACNCEEEDRAKAECRDPILLPHFSAHNLRHTFCTRYCENESDLKVIQEVMGHQNIGVTMDTYNEATKERKIASFAKLEGKIKIS